VKLLPSLTTCPCADGAKEALQWIAAEELKQQPSGGLAWTQLSKRDKINLMLAEVQSED